MTSRNNAMPVEQIECTPIIESIEMSVIPWLNWCRLCAKERNKLWNEVADDEKPNVHFIKALEMFFNVKIHDDDLMPKHLCQECMTVVNNTIAYNEHVLNVQNMYYHLIDNSDELDFERLRSEFKVGPTETKLIFSNYSKAIISFLNSSSNLGTDLDDNYDDNDCCIQKHEMDIVDNTISENIANNNDLDPLIDEKQVVDSKESLREITLKTRTAKRSETAERKTQKFIRKPVIVLEDNTDQPMDLNCKECNHHISSFLLYDEHMRKEHSNLLKANLLKCLECEIKYDNNHQLKKHYRTVHQPEQPIYKCNECDISLKNATGLAMHLKSEHGINRPFECKECGLSVSTEVNFKSHMLTHTKEKPYECAQCDRRFKSKGRLNAHVKVKHLGIKHICHICGLSFDLVNTLNTHYAVHSDECKYKCEYCGRLFKQERYLKQHLIHHTNLRLFKCEFCDKTFANSSGRRTHMKGRHPNEVQALDAVGYRPKTIFPTVDDLKAAYLPNKEIRTGKAEGSRDQPLDINCMECGHHISSFLLYEEHMRKTHSNLLKEYIFKCWECEIKYDNIHQLKTHYRSKHQHSIYKCKECDISLKSPKELVLHSKSEHGIDRPFVCNECGHSVRTEINLKSHMLIHTEEKPYDCKQCDQSFKSKARLNVHIKVKHLGIEHICHICGMSFDRLSTLKKHYGVHTVECKYKCEYCGRLFKQERYRKKHLITHTNLRPFKCEICDKTFTCSSSRRTHMKGKHPKEVEALDAIGCRPQKRLPTVEELKAAYTPNKKIRKGMTSPNTN